MREFKTGRQDWFDVRPPLVDLNAGQQATLHASLDRVGFTVPTAVALA